MDTVQQYLQAGSREQSNWRSVILFGRNVASYKFALGQAIIDLAKQGKDSVTLDQLAQPYAAHLCEHVGHSPRQATSSSSKFIEACSGFVEGSVAYDDLMATTVSLGFNNVLDAFHVVNRQEIPVRFFLKDFSGKSKRIILTDDVFRLAASADASNILQETEARWNLVETAWRLGISSNLLAVEFDGNGGGIITATGANRRRSVTSARGALNGYQKGRCFYCYRPINAADGYRPQAEEPKLLMPDEPPRVECAVVSLDAPGSEPACDPLCDIDHFFPHVLGRAVRGINLDGVWNLVLACPDCNRGEGGKFFRIPTLDYLQRLHRRNEYLITSHHPLRDAIVAQTGVNARARWKYLLDVDRMAGELLPGARWSTEQLAPAIF